MINFDELDPALAFAIGELEELARVEERDRILNLAIQNKVIRRDALGHLVFVNCDTMQVEYLEEGGI